MHVVNDFIHIITNKLINNNIISCIVTYTNTDRYRYRTQCHNNVYVPITWLVARFGSKDRGAIILLRSPRPPPGTMRACMCEPRGRESDHFGPTCARRRWSTAAPGNRPRLSSGSWCMERWRGCTSMSCGWPVPWTGTRSCSRPSARWENSCRSCLRCGHWWVTIIPV